MPNYISPSIPQRNQLHHPHLHKNTKLNTNEGPKRALNDTQYS